MTLCGFRFTTLALASAAACALAAPAGAQLLNHKDLSASIAIAIVQATIDTCKANGYKVSATVVGRNGEIIAQARGDDTGPHTIENSFRNYRVGYAAAEAVILLAIVLVLTGIQFTLFRERGRRA